VCRHTLVCGTVLTVTTIYDTIIVLYEAFVGILGREKPFMAPTLRTEQFSCGARNRPGPVHLMHNRIRAGSSAETAATP